MLQNIMLMPQFNPGLHPHSKIESQNTVRLRREAGQIKEIVARISGCNTFHGMANFLENSQSELRLATRRATRFQAELLLALGEGETV